MTKLTHLNIPTAYTYRHKNPNSEGHKRNFKSTLGGFLLRKTNKSAFSAFACTVLICRPFPSSFPQFLHQPLTTLLNFASRALSDQTDSWSLSRFSSRQTIHVRIVQVMFFKRIGRSLSRLARSTLHKVTFNSNLLSLLLIFEFELFLLLIYFYSLVTECDSR